METYDDVSKNIDNLLIDFTLALRAEILKLKPVPPPVTPPTLTYTVISGDTLAKIGIKFGVPWLIIASANNISSPYSLKIGQVLIIPTATQPPPVEPPVIEGQDKFGVKQLYPSRPDGLLWESKWNNGHARSFASAVDPDDPWFDCNHGDASYKIDGNGVFSITGPVPRMYVYEPSKTKQWHDVEVTMYGMRVADAGTDWGGMEACVRANHGTTGKETVDLCDTRSNNCRFRYDGKLDFEKETSHPASVPISTKTYWPNGMPKNVWIGMKFVCYDLPNGDVKLEAYMDETDGLNGGTWKKVNEFIDTGTNWGTNGRACKIGINPAMKLTGSETREGSESGKPNICVYFRSDDVFTDGLKYKKFSAREIKV
jgi:LysM repeat protein